MQQGIMQIFSESQEYFAAVTADNRLKVWDVVRRQNPLFRILE
jgi:hypothetical protein